MKKFFVPLFIIALTAFSAVGADFSAKVTNVHLCCQSCVKGVQKAVAEVPGATVAVDQDAETVTLTAPEEATAQKAADALVAAGYFGKSADDRIKLKADTGVKNEKVQTLKVKGVHLCCGKCVKSVNEALATVPGVKANTAAKGAKSFEVTGDFNDQNVFDALQKAGLSGTVE